MNNRINGIPITMFDRLAGTGEDDTDAFNEGLAFMKEGDRLFLPKGDLEYNVSAPLTSPTGVNYWTIGGSAGAMPKVNYTGTSITEPMIEFNGRGSGISFMEIRGSLVASHGARNLGIRFKNTSNNICKNIRIIDMGVAATFENTHDSKDLAGCEFINNWKDILIDPDIVSSSLRFNEFTMFDSEFCFESTNDFNNLCFDGCTISPRPFSANGSPFSIEGFVLGLVIERCRFEIKRTNNATGVWNALRLKGKDATLPAEPATIVGNYFTGNAGGTDNAILLDGFTDSVRIQSNIFKRDPANSDVRYLFDTTNINTIENGNRAMTARTKAYTIT